MNDRLRSSLLASSRWRSAKWLVIAPHADDETLGCGALISETAQAGKLAAVAFLTDGAGSHPCQNALERIRLIARREQEARAAIRILAPRSRAPLFLSWPDAAPYPQSAPQRAATVARLGALCRTSRVDAIAVTGRDEPHCDHVAAFEVAKTVAATAGRPIAIFEYIVWAKQHPGRDFSVLRTAPMNLGTRHNALARHRSQLTPIFGEGFRVPATMRSMDASDLLYIRLRP